MSRNLGLQLGEPGVLEKVWFSSLLLVCRSSFSHGDAASLVGSFSTFRIATVEMAMVGLVVLTFLSHVRLTLHQENLLP
jgi:hypothetical protein